MESLIITSESGKDVTTSLLIAKTFGKSHKNVLRDIENLNCSNEFGGLNFGLTYYTDASNRQSKMYEITKDGFSFLVMGYTGEKAGEFKERFIFEFNKREALLKNDDFIVQKALSILGERVKGIEAENGRLTYEKQLLQGELTKAVPKVNYYDTVLQSNSTYTTNQIAKELGLSAIGLNKRLHDLQIQYKQSDTWLLYAKYQDKGYTKTKTHTYTDNHGNQQTAMMTVWTEKGRLFVHGIVDIGSHKFNLTQKLEKFDSVSA